MSQPRRLRSASSQTAKSLRTSMKRPPSSSSPRLLALAEYETSCAKLDRTLHSLLETSSVRLTG